MKKIIILITLLTSLVFLSFFQTTHAALIETEITFSLSNYRSEPGKNYVAETGENMYQKIHSFFNMEANQSVAVPITVKKGALTYEGRIVHSMIHDASSQYDSLNTYRYSILFDRPSGETIRFTFFNKAVYRKYSNGPGYIYDYDILNTESEISSSLIDSANYPSMMGAYTIVAMIETEIDPDDGTNVSNDLSLIPTTTGTLIDASNSSKVGYVYFEHDTGAFYDTYIMVNGEQYNIGKLTLPGVIELGKEPLSPGIYWTEGSKRYIYYEFRDYDIPLNNQVNLFLDDPQNIKGFRPFVQMNLTDSTYELTDKLVLYANFHGESGGRAFADVVFPMDLDELLSIEIQYRQRWVKLWGLSRTPYETKRITRYKDEAVNMNTTWNHVVNYMLKGTYGLWNSLLDWNETITEVTPIEPEYKNDYLSNINRARKEQNKTSLTMSQIFTPESSVYRVYLDTYYNGNYTGYEIEDEIIILDVMYQYKGEVYQVGYEDIETISSGGSGGDTSLPTISGIPELNPMFASFVVILVALGVGLFRGNLFTRRGINRNYLFGTLFLAVITYLLIGNWPSLFG